jgi:hypothetical protein
MFGGRGLGGSLRSVFRGLQYKQKIGVPRHHGNMLPGNSFPQICVVSVNRIVENTRMAQEYLRVLA